MFLKEFDKKGIPEWSGPDVIPEAYLFTKLIYSRSLFLFRGTLRFWRGPAERDFRSLFIPEAYLFPKLIFGSGL